VVHRHGDFTTIRKEAMDDPPAFADLDGVSNNIGVFVDELSNVRELNVRLFVGWLVHGLSILSDFGKQYPLTS
jgi:hypothetical protein